VKIWIDLANSPQVLFFRPLIPEIEREGHVVTVTTRHFAQTVELANRIGLTHKPIGVHGGEHISNIGLTLMKRAWQLLRFAKGENFDLAISHNSYAQAFAAKLLGIPFVTSMDYEHQPANHFAFRLARKVVVPEFFPEKSLRRFGVRGKKVARYHGTKEEIYLGDFKPQSGYLESLEISTDMIIIVMIPPGTWALYHHFENPLFDAAIEHIVQKRDAKVIFLPRIPSQAKAIEAKGYKNIFLPPVVLDGPNLLYHADLVVSAGGTMNREAAVLGTPTYSLFKGKLAAVDSYLVQKGRMRHIDSTESIVSIPICRKSPNRKMDNPVQLIQEVAKILLHC